MEIKYYTLSDEFQLFEMIREEGTDWESYYSDESKEMYQQALNSSITCVVYIGDVLCGYIRCRDDNGYGVYVYDLLVRKSYRGQNIGRKLIDFIRGEYPEDIVYIMSDEDEYYLKQGFRRIGSIFEV